MRRLLLASLLLSGCATTERRGLTLISQQQRHTLHTRAGCASDPEVIRAADMALVLVVREAAAAGLVGYDIAPDRLRGLSVCLVEEPEPCCIGSLCASGGPKAGCSGAGWAWVSRHWAGAVRDWAGDLLHELTHAVAYMAWSSYPADHSGPWAEIERRAQVAYRAAVVARP